MKLILTIKKNNTANLKLRAGNKVIGHEGLTLSQDFDNMLITSIDRLLKRNTIDRLSLKSLKIQGKIRLGSTSLMVMAAVKSGLEV
jgi:hypothetical protein